MNKLLKLVWVSTILLCSATALSADKKADAILSPLPKFQQEAHHKDIAKRVASKLKHLHYQEVIFDEAFAAKMFDRYFSMLDYGKYLFLASDINHYRQKQTLFFSGIESGQLDVAYSFFNDAIEKQRERYKLALTLLDQPMSFDTNETINIQYLKIGWAQTKEELNDRWRKKVKYDWLNLMLAGKSQEEARVILRKRYNIAIRKLNQTSSEDVFQLVMNALSREIDPHSSYLAPKSKKQFNSEMNLSFEGIGAVLKVEDEQAVIASLITGGPAAKSKALSVGDRILGVGQTNKEIEDVVGWSLDDIVELIRGPKSTKVRIQILPAGQNAKPRVVTITRDKIRMEEGAVKSSIVEIKGKKVGVLTIPSFYIGLTDDTKIKLNALRKQKVNSIVIDLRGNGGGSLSEAIGLSGLFIQSGPIVQIKDSQKRIKGYDNKDGWLYYNGPIVVMVDRFSASASEIFAAAMQDYGRAIVVGETTFGKGTVQTHQPLTYSYDQLIHPDWPELGALQYTIQKFYRINGGSTQLKGVTPDVMLSSLVSDEFGERFEENALPWDSIKSANYNIIRRTDTLIPALTKMYKERIATNREFSYIQRDIREYNEKKSTRYLISLNYKQREKETREYDEKMLRRANERLKEKGLPLIKSLDDLPKDNKLPDPYLDEVVLISLDFSMLYPSISGKVFELDD